MIDPAPNAPVVACRPADQPAADAVDALVRMMSKDRAVTDQELILAGVVEQLGAGACTAEKVLHGLLTIWPGTGLNAVRLSAALRTAEEAQLIFHSVGRDGEELWALTQDGSLELEMTRVWRENMRAHTREQVRAAAIDAFGIDPGDEKIRCWTQLIEQAIRAGVRESGGVFNGEVAGVGISALLPRAVDTEAMRKVLFTDRSPEEVKQFLLGCTAAAVDATDPFGTELVNTIVVGFILHATVARRDLAESGAATGSLAGQRLALDTPVLIALIGPRSLAEPTEQVLRLAVSAGMEVVVADHTIDELVTSLEHARLTALPEARRVMTTSEVAAFGRLVDNDIVALATAAISEGRYRDWEEFEEAGGSIRSILNDLEINNRPHGNLDPDTVLACRQALVAELSSRDRHRASVNLDRDANTMAMVWRVRRRARGSSFWPGGWMITSDRSVAPAMHLVEKGVDWPFTLSLSQLAALIARCADVPSIAELTRAAAALVTHDASDALASRYPLIVASELAHALTSGASDLGTDVRIAQAGLRGVLSNTDVLDPAIVTSRVLTARQRRIKLASDAHSAANEARTGAAQDQVRARESELNRAAAVITQLQAKLDAEATENARIRSEFAEHEAAMLLNAKRSARRRWLAAILVSQALAAVLLVLYGDPVVALLPVAGAVIFWARLRSWVRDGEGLLVQVLIAGIPDVITVGLFVWSLLGH